MTIADWSQVVSAAATTASVLAALWLARRGESQRLRFYTSVARIITVGMQPRTAEEAITNHLRLTIVNAGVLPAHVQIVFFQAWLKTSARWSQVVTPEGAQLPVVLNHGEQLSLTMPVYGARLPTGSLLAWWWQFRKVQFDVRTTLGTTTVRLKWSELKWLRRAVMEARSLD